MQTKHKNGKNNKSNQKNYKTIILPTIAIVFVVIVGVIFFLNNNTTNDITNNTNNIVPTTNDGIIIDTTTLTTKVSFIDYVTDGTKMQVMSVIDSNGTPRVALNTCQSCNGSPYAYFVQDGEYVVCQNCGQYFAIDVMGIAKDGCNPIPIEHNIDGNNIIITNATLKQYASLFTNWKKGI